MLMPSRVKFRKAHRGRLKGKAQKGNTIAFGSFGLQSLSNKWVTARQIEAARVTLARYTKKGGKVWVRIFPDKPISQKPAETRMGKGKGDPAFWVAVVKRGRIMFEMEGITQAEAKEAMRQASDKLPVKCQFLQRLEV
jgi:large subunit ribosomal protein L16